MDVRPTWIAITCNFSACLADINPANAIAHAADDVFPAAATAPHLAPPLSSRKRQPTTLTDGDPDKSLETLQIGKVEEIFGGIQNAYFTVKMSEGVIATSYAAGDKFFIDPAKLLPLERFLPQPKGSAPRGGRGARLGWPHCAPELRTRTAHLRSLVRWPAPDFLVQTCPWRI